MIPRKIWARGAKDTSSSGADLRAQTRAEETSMENLIDFANGQPSAEELPNEVVRQALPGFVGFRRGGEWS